MSNIFNHFFRLVTFGESHGNGLGCVIDGCPAGLNLSEQDVQFFLDRRKPGQSNLTSPRKEADQCEIVSGVYNGKTLGSPICILIRNQDQRSKDYTDINQIFRPGHADYTYAMKYGYQQNDVPPGGGRASARETIGRVAGGAVAKIFVTSVLPDIKIFSYINRIHNIERENVSTISLNLKDFPLLTPEMEQVILQAKENGDSVGGTIHTVIQNLPPGFGEPVFDKLEADLAKSMLSIPAVKFFESGDGLSSTYKFGSENNDEFHIDEKGQVFTTTNRSGGIQGGISNGMPVTFTVGFKPVSTIFKEQKTVTRDGKEKIFSPKAGRHDPCVLPRALIIVEAMTWLVLADKLKAQLSCRLKHLW